MRKTLALVFCAAGTALADDVYMKSGRSFSGMVLEETATQVVVQTGPGEVRLPRALVERIVRSTSTLADFEDRAATLPPDSAAAGLELARWAARQGLATQAGRAYERVLALDPGNVEAHEALGHVEIEGRWLSGDDAHAARGELRFEGQWLTAAEFRAILAKRMTQRRPPSAREAAAWDQEMASLAQAAREADDWARWDRRDADPAPATGDGAPAVVECDDCPPWYQSNGATGGSHGPRPQPGSAFPPGTSWIPPGTSWVPPATSWIPPGTSWVPPPGPSWVPPGTSWAPPIPQPETSPPERTDARSSGSGFHQADSSDTSSSGSDNSDSDSSSSDSGFQQADTNSDPSPSDGYFHQID